MTDFNAMSPAELRNFAKDNEVDLSSVDSRRKADLINLLKAWEAGGGTPLEQTDETAGTPIDLGENMPAEPPVDTVSGPATSPVVTGPRVLQPSPSKFSSASGQFAATVTEPQTPAPRRALEELTLTDLVADDNRVRVQVNTFPMVVDAKDLVRLIIAEVPGEADTLAIAWWRQTTSGPQLQDGVKRLTSQMYDPESRVTSYVTEDGQAHEYKRSTECGTCGNRLGNWRPWKPPVRIVQMARR